MNSVSLGADRQVLDGESLCFRVHSAELQQSRRQVAVPVVQRFDGHADGAGEGGGVVAERRVLPDLVERRRQLLGFHLGNLVGGADVAERKQRYQFRVTREDAQEHLDSDLFEVGVAGDDPWPGSSDQLSLTHCDPQV